jgi:hypothetical protein
MTKKHEVSFIRSSAADYLTFVAAVNQHLRRTFIDHELDEEAVIKHCLTTATDGKSEIARVHAESDFDRVVKQLEHAGKKNKGKSE